MLTLRQGVKELLMEHLIRWGTAKDLLWGEAYKMAVVEEARRQAAASRIAGLGRGLLARNRLDRLHAFATKIQSIARM
jgi:hypothetical protein